MTVKWGTTIRRYFLGYPKLGKQVSTRPHYRHGLTVLAEYFRLASEAVGNYQVIYSCKVEIVHDCLLPWVLWIWRNGERLLDI